MGESGKNQTNVEGSKIQIIKSVCLRLILIICFLLPVLKSAAPGFIEAAIIAPEPINAYGGLIRAIVMVESSGDTMAFNPVEQAYGAFQIRPIRLLDYYQRTGKKYTTEDCFSFAISKEIFLFYAEMLSYPDFQTIARNWNGSGKMTLDYWKKIKKYLEYENSHKEKSSDRS